jgi:predicted dienelactone hydrolase
MICCVSATGHDKSRFLALALALVYGLISGCGSSSGGADAAAPTEVADGIGEAQGDAAAPPALPHDPGAWGPHEVGLIELPLFDEARQREVRTVVWYPALPQPAAEPVTYLYFVEGRAVAGAPLDPAGAPYPLVLFSHGFNGVAEQSKGFTEHLASHGYVVAAMDHVGNTLADSNADDEEVADAALQRPVDVRFAAERVITSSRDADYPLAGAIDAGRVAMSGHSFGGYTALLVAGGQVDVDEALAACEAGTPADIFCPYIGSWPSGEIVQLQPPIPDLRALIALAPGGSAAFGDDGLAGVTVPKLVFGGSLDDTTPVDVEIRPIYEALPAPKIEAILDGAVHLSFTIVCDIPVAAEALAEFCGEPDMLGAGDTAARVNPLAVAFLNVHLKGLDVYERVLTADYVAEHIGGVQWTSR